MANYLNPYDPNDIGTGAIDEGAPQHVILSGAEYERYLNGALNEPANLDALITRIRSSLDRSGQVIGDWDNSDRLAKTIAIDIPTRIRLANEMTIIRAYASNVLPWETTTVVAHMVHRSAQHRSAHTHAAGAHPHADQAIHAHPNTHTIRIRQYPWCTRQYVPYAYANTLGAHSNTHRGRQEYPRGGPARLPTVSRGFIFARLKNPGRCKGQAAKYVVRQIDSPGICARIALISNGFRT